MSCSCLGLFAASPFSARRLEEGVAVSSAKTPPTRPAQRLIACRQRTASLPSLSSLPLFLVFVSVTARFYLRCYQPPLPQQSTDTKVVIPPVPQQHKQTERRGCDAAGDGVVKGAAPFMRYRFPCCPLSLKGGEEQSVSWLPFSFIAFSVAFSFAFKSLCVLFFCLFVFWKA